jgi:hypothetical protein
MMDKFFLLTYTILGEDGFYHSRYAWFQTEDEMRMFLEKSAAKGDVIETDLAIEVLSHRKITL